MARRQTPRERYWAEVRRIAEDQDISIAEARRLWTRQAHDRRATANERTQAQARRFAADVARLRAQEAAQRTPPPPPPPPPPPRPAAPVVARPVVKPPLALVVTANQASSRHCPYCRDSIGGPISDCPRCRATYHGDCAAELKTCATRGCGGQLPGRPTGCAPQPPAPPPPPPPTADAIPDGTPCCVCGRPSEAGDRLETISTTVGGVTQVSVRCYPCSLGMQKRVPCTRCGGHHSNLDHLGRCMGESLAACRAARRAGLVLLGGLAVFVAAVGFGGWLLGLNRHLTHLLGLVAAILTGLTVARIKGEMVEADVVRESIPEPNESTATRERPRGRDQAQ